MSNDYLNFRNGLIKLDKAIDNRKIREREFIGIMVTKFKEIYKKIIHDWKDTPKVYDQLTPFLNGLLAATNKLDSMSSPGQHTALDIVQQAQKELKQSDPLTSEFYTAGIGPKSGGRRKRKTKKIRFKTQRTLRVKSRRV
jgi:hypothetical protein